VLIESGFGWLPALGWRLDKHWERMRDEVPHVKRPPSEYIREHFWVSTQPMEEAEEPEHVLDAMRWIGFDRILFAERLSALGFRRSVPRAAAEPDRRAAPHDLCGQRQEAVRAQLMARHVVAPVDDIPPGGRKLVEVNGRAVVVFNLGGEFFALNNRCPHRGGSLCEGKQTGLVQSSEPGDYQYTRKGEIIRCPWHSWEFDIRTGQSWCDPARVKTRRYEVSVEQGARLVEGPYKAETFPVSVENAYVVVEA
jgi:nitrite reductase/ring-hydroxylating ferredoxin subunit